MVESLDLKNGVWIKAALIPTAWAVECPSCGAEIEIDVEDDDAGVFHGRADCRFPACPECDALIEVMGARLVDVDAEPWSVTNG